MFFFLSSILHDFIRERHLEEFFSNFLYNNRDKKGEQP